MKKFVLVIPCAIVVCLAIYLYSHIRASRPLTLSDAPYWQTFAIVDEPRTVPWVGSFQAESWEFRAKSGASVQVKRFTATTDELKWLLKEWLARTRTLQMTTVDPYFPGITKELDCEDDFKIKIATESEDRSYFVTMAGGRNYVAGACHKTEAEYRVYRKLVICSTEGPGENGALIVADFFVKLTEATPQARDAFRNLPCSAFTPR